MKKSIVYKAALYLRVSKEDTEKENSHYFSNSIENQKQYLLNYLKKMPEVTIYDFYIEAASILGLNFEKTYFYNFANFFSKKLEKND